MAHHSSVAIDGLRLHTVRKGTGRPIIVIGSSVYYPRLFTDELYQHYTFLFVDHRGFVTPPRPLEPSEYTLERILADIETIRQSFGLSDIVVLGHSGHAFLALEYARVYPDHVRGVVLLNSAPTNSAERQQQSIAYFQETASDERKRQFEQDIAQLEGDLQRDPDRRFVHMCIRMGAHSFYDYAFDAAHLWKGVDTHMPIIDSLWGDVFGRLNMVESLTDMKKPVFLGLGLYDYLVAPVSLWDAVDAANYPHVHKVVFPESGHNPMLEQPDAFNHELLAWLRANDF